MKYQELTFSAALGTLKHQWKLMLSTFLVFVLLGAGFGAVYSDKLSTPAAGSAEIYPLTDFSEVQKDVDYYTTCAFTLEKSYQNLEAYLQSVSEERTLTKTQEKTLDAFIKKTDAWGKEYLRPIQKDLGSANALYIPSAFIDEEIDTCRSNLIRVEQNIIISAQAVELLKNMEAPRYDSADVTGSYASLLQKAANYGEYLSQKEQYEKKLDQLENQRTTVMKAAAEIEQKERTALKTLNTLEEKATQIVDEIVKSNYLELTLDFDDNNTVSVTINHTHSASTVQETFVLVVLFCSLTGLFLGAFLAVCAECKVFRGFKRKTRKD